MESNLPIRIPEDITVSRMGVAFAFNDPESKDQGHVGEFFLRQGRTGDNSVIVNNYIQRVENLHQGVGYPVSTEKKDSEDQNRAELEFFAAEVKRLTDEMKGHVEDIARELRS
jgi:hypothetical protein